jgi:hypothetical protein
VGRWIYYTHAHLDPSENLKKAYLGGFSMNVKPFLEIYLAVQSSNVNKGDKSEK